MLTITRPQLLEAGFASAGRIESKKQVFGDLEEPADSFIVLNASRPGKRKRVDLTIEGFARFAADKSPNVCLCLHHAMMLDYEEAEIKALIGKLGLEKRVYLNPLGARVVSDQELNLLYNACDVGINTSMGEGWGLVNFEHGAAGAAQIVPDHSACSELWRGRAEMIPPARSFIPEISVLEMGEVSPEGVATALDNLYRDPNRTQELARAAFTAAQNPKFSWDIIARQFEDLFVGSQPNSLL
jgi:glycosyltransferase involved in cell wall biosynthesis